jgi:uncharacterized protein YdaU (DUF1376 family)
MSKSHDTWMPFYVGDYLRKTMHLTIDQHGAYLMLIMACWCDGGALPDDDEHLAAICRVPVSRWKKLRAAIERFFTIDETGWHNSRVTEELSKAADITEHRRSAGRASVQARSHKKAAANGLASDEPSVDTNAQQTGRPSPKATVGSPKNNLKNITSNSENITAREESEDFKKFGEGVQGGRFAPLAAIAALKRDQLIQKLIRFTHATMAEPELTTAVTGLCGGDPDPSHDEQWWLDHLDQLMRAQHWDDTERRIA